MANKGLVSAVVEEMEIEKFELSIEKPSGSAAVLRYSPDGFPHFFAAIGLCEALFSAIYPN